MVQVLQGNRPKNFAQSILGGIAENTPQALQDYINISQENKALQRNLGLDLSGIKDQNTRQKLIADQLAFGRKMKQAQASQGVQLGGNGSDNQKSSPQDIQRFLQENQIPEKQQSPNFLEKQNQHEMQDDQAFTHAPQPETSGTKRKLLTPEQLLEKGKKIAQEYTNANIPMSPQEGVQIARELEEQKKSYNSEVENDIRQQVESQKNYGNLANEKLLKIMPNATDEQQSVFMRKGEEFSKNKSEAEINKMLSKEAVKFKNSIANVKKSIPAPRLVEGAKQDVLGTNRSWEKRRDDIRLKLQPLLKEGLYDTARDLLSELGYHPEEREGIISDLGENAKKSLIKLPKMEKTTIPEDQGLFRPLKFGPNGAPAISQSPEKSYSPEDSEMIKNNIKEVLTADPSTNLVLLRKAYEEKNVDWRKFKDDLNELIFNGDIKLNDDQFNHLDLLDNPPLDNLDKILFGLKLIGR